MSVLLAGSKTKLGVIVHLSRNKLLLRADNTIVPCLLL